MTSWPDPDATLDDVAGKIERVVKELRAKRAAPASAASVSAVAAAVRAPAVVPPAAVGEKPASKGGADAAAATRGQIADFSVFRDVDEPWCPEMVALPAGEFLMGSPKEEKERYDNEGPQHQVTIGRRWRCAIGRYPVMFDEYDHFCEATQREKLVDPGWGRGKRPVINVTWRDAVAYCEWLSKETGQSYRLPSEAEWEYACRAGTATRYSFGEEISEKDANYASKVGKATEVGAYPANPWGVYDMHGNVWEWVEDVWHDSYKGAPTDGRAWTDGEGGNSSRVRVLRGGSWLDYPRVLRSAGRSGGRPVDRVNYLGFRVARTLD